MVRDPREDWLSWDKVLKLRIKDYSKIRLNKRDENIQSYAHFIENLQFFSSKLERDHLRIVDLNKLHLLNKDGMVRLTCWLNISFQDSLLESTFLGKTWHGNSADRSPISGFSTSKTFYKWPNELDVVDSLEISKCLSVHIKALGYSLEKKRSYNLRNRYVKFSACIRLHFDEARNAKSYKNWLLKAMPLTVAKLAHIIVGCMFGVRELISPPLIIRFKREDFL
jgi:hypothetical protein